MREFLRQIQFHAGSLRARSPKHMRASRSTAAVWRIRRAL
jgi:hypothetical protein